MFFTFSGEMNTEDDDNTENELLKSAHLNMEEQIYIGIKRVRICYRENGVLRI